MAATATSRPRGRRRDRGRRTRRASAAMPDRVAATCHPESRTALIAAPPVEKRRAAPRIESRAASRESGRPPAVLAVSKGSTARILPGAGSGAKRSAGVEVEDDPEDQVDGEELHALEPVALAVAGDLGGQED